MRKLFNTAWTRKVIANVSKLEFLLLEVAVLLIVFVVVQGNSPNAEAYEIRELAAMTVVWDRPVGYASFIDSGSKQANCTSSGTSCSTASGTYWPGSPLYYSVKVANREGYLFKSGSVTASSTGRASASWNWNYSVVVWPNSQATCQDAGSHCKTANLSNNNSSIAETFGNLAVNTDYRVVVCAPNCGTGTKIVDRVQRTAIPARLNPVSDAAMTCVNNKVNVNFGWVVASGAVMDQQFLDFSVYDNNFAPGTFQTGLNIVVGQNSYTGVGFEPNTKYYWRVNSRLGYSANAFVTSSTSVFTTKNCFQPPVITCQVADVNRDGFVNVSDQGLTNQNKAPAPYNPRYDLDKNNIVDNADVLYVTSKFGSCTSRDYAISLNQSATCSSVAPGNTVKVDFFWTNATNSYTETFLDYDVVPHGDVGWPANIAKKLNAGQTSLTLENFTPNVTYYWRINTRVNGVWASSAMKSFKTPEVCSFSTTVEPKDLTLAVGVSTTLPGTTTKCSDKNYNVAIRWTGLTGGLSVEIAKDNVNFDANRSPIHKRDVSNIGILFTSGSDFSPSFSFEPGATYTWRMYLATTQKWYSAANPTFKVDYCNAPALNNVPSGWPTQHGRISQGIHSLAYSNGALDIENNVAATGGTLEDPTPILATFDGSVIDICLDGQACNYGELGNAVIMSNTSRTFTIIYAHMKDIPLVSIGQQVKKGNILGGMGRTGKATGVHLHYEFRGLDLSVGSTVPSTTFGFAW